MTVSFHSLALNFAVFGIGLLLLCNRSLPPERNGFQSAMRKVVAREAVPRRYPKKGKSP